jgi:predicted ATP-grasp superfamily ATP-dependent carboligase
MPVRGAGAGNAEGGQVPVLVAEAQSMGGVAVIRSLGRAGYQVHALGDKPDALGFYSRFAAAHAVGPDCDDPAFVPWFREYVARHRIRVIIPSEGILLSLRSALDEFAPLLPVSTDTAALYRGLSKVDLFCFLAKESGAGSNIPPSTIVERELPPGDLSLLGPGPYYIKGDACYATDPITTGKVYRVARKDALPERLGEALHHYKRVLVQGHVPGQGVGVFFLRWRGEVLAEFMHRRVHEVPHTGGVSSFRESWWHAAVRDDALAKLEALDWEGVAMMEYRWEPDTDCFHFIEMNGRFWGSLHLALFAGIDFPALLVDAMLGRPVPPARIFPQGLRCRYTFPKEFQYVWSRLSDGRLSPASKLWTVAEFFLLSLDPRVRSDLLFPADRGLYWRRLARFARTLG